EARPGGPRVSLNRLMIRAPGPARRYLGDRNRVPATAPLNERLVQDCKPAGRSPQTPAARNEVSYTIANRDRTFGARLSGEIASRYGDAGLPAGATIDVHLMGYAGQSFGAFGVPGLHIDLSGAANDYVGKGLGGGRLVIHPRPQDRLRGLLSAPDDLSA